MCCELTLDWEVQSFLQDFEGADVRFGDVGDLESLRSVAFSEKVDAVISCLASRTGGKVQSLLSYYFVTYKYLSLTAPGLNFTTAHPFTPHISWWFMHA